MFRATFVSLLVVFLTWRFVGFAGAAPVEPATAPAAELLASGQIRYVPPPGWDLLGRRADDRSVGYAAPGDKAQIVITVAPQTETIPNALAPKLAATIRQALEQEAAKGNIEQVMPPKAEPDKRFLLRVHDRFKSREGKLSDRVQLFRGIGRNLVSVTSNAFTEDEDEAKRNHEIAERVMLSIRLSRPANEAAPADEGASPTSRPAESRTIIQRQATSRPVVERTLKVLPEVKLRIAPPSGWKEELTHASSGLIATWRDPTDTTNLITLTYRPVPTQAKDDAKLRQLAVEETARGEKPTFEVAGAEAIGQTRTITDRRFLRKTRTDYEAEDVKFRVGFRQIRIGDAVVSITSVALSDKADEIDRLADDVAASVRGAAAVNAER